MITGIHHVSMRCRGEAEYRRVLGFYTDLLGLKPARQWDGAVMVDTGGGYIEIFRDRGDAPVKGVVNHFALACTDTAATAEKLKTAGYEVFMGPAEVTLPCDPPLPACIAFVRGPRGEEIELFQERG